MNSKNKVYKNAFCVMNLSSTPNSFAVSNSESILDELSALWISDNPDRGFRGALCVSSAGLVHIHFIVSDYKSFRFSKIKKIFPAAHIEDLKSNMQVAETYIQKLPPYNEKNEKVIRFKKYGTAIQNTKSKTNANKNSIEQLIQQGYTPDQIYSISPKYYYQDKIIKKAYFSRMKKINSSKRNLTVYWHTGDSGTGKTSAYDQLPPDQTFYVPDYYNGIFDDYSGQPNLFIDDLKSTLPTSMLVTLLSGYTAPIHCRYIDTYMLWDIVHITSLYSPEEYCELCKNVSSRELHQLLNRIDYIIYHYKSPQGNEQVIIPINEYKNISIIKKKYRNK